MADTDRKPPRAGMGRPKGAQNKTTALLKDAILKAAEQAGDGDMVEYLTLQARTNPGPFMALLGKVLPMQIAGDPDNPIIHAIERRIVRPSDTNS
ncbi:hypothetical protein [Ensifer adhaerens]|uniref:Uncharacterized protein n=1 Tax=Ensifer adhaerens TaxID=106592 RepID=A0ABY8HCJ9_ENSAD|nr:hypothetical protein [Ensifer adhaerens]KDP70298.1 hypothetical protein FA04_29115 [Ensifer adhaerens]WFP89825.1 hypothetical protein P4B07_14825 [Ensifer adhaerens]